MNIETLQIIEFELIIKKIKHFALTTEAQYHIENLMPSTDYMRILSLQDETTEATDILKNSTSIPLLGLNGIPSLLDKLTKEMVLQPDELEKIKHVLINTKKFKSFMKEYHHIAPTISQYVYSMFELSDIKEEINRCIYNNRVDDKAINTLAKIRKQVYIIESRIKAKLDSMTKSTTIKKYLQDSSVTIKNNRYVLQVKASYKHEIPGVVIDKSSTGSTFFIEPTAVNKYQEELNQLKIDEANEIYQILSYLSSLVLEKEHEFSVTLETFITYDVIFAKAKYAKSIDANAVKINTDQYIKINNGRHPLLGDEAVPLDFEIGTDYHALVITGPNTGGKTVALKTIALFTAMVQTGLHVPCDPSSNFAIYGNILADIGDGQSIEQSLSTFSSHIKKIINIVNLANKYTLVVLDEIGSGTDPTEGEGLAIALLDTLYHKGSTIIATSHYGKVKEYAKESKGFINGKMHFDVDSLKPTYQLTIGQAGESNAFIIALRLGLDPSIINHAHQVTYNEVKDYSNLELFKNTYVLKNSKAKKPKKFINTHVNTSQSQTNNPNEDINDYDYHIGDQVFAKTLKTKGIVFEATNHKQEVGVYINKRKIYIHKRKLKLLIKSEQLYPTGYDFDIIFKSKEYRKNDKLLNRKYIKGFSSEIKEEDL